MKELFPYIQHRSGACDANWNVSRRAFNEALIPCTCGLDDVLRTHGILDDYIAYWEARRAAAVAELTS